MRHRGAKSKSVEDRRSDCMSLLRCNSVAKWLDQFTVGERPLAAMALERLTFVTTDEVKHDLAVELSSRVNEAITRGSKVIIESILSKEDVERFLSQKRSSRERTSNRVCTPSLFLGKYRNLSHSGDILADWVPSKASKSVRKSKPTRSLYDEYYPSEIRDEQAGSEKYLDLVVRSEHTRISRECKAAKRSTPLLLGRAEIEPILYSKQPIDLILVTDNIGSGAQIVDFLSSVLLSHTLGGLQQARVRITVLSWTATVQGIEAINEWAQASPLGAQTHPNPQITLDVFYLRATESFHDLEDSMLLDEMKTLFKKYGRKGNGGGLGFGGTASRTVMLGSSCPNNLPDFFYISNTKKPHYRALFESKAIPADLIDYLIYDHPKPVPGSNYDPRFIADIKNQSLIQAFKRNSDGGPAWRVLLCSVAGYSRWSTIRALKISVHQFDQAHATLILLGWINPNFTPTEIGISTVRRTGLKRARSDYASKDPFINRLDRSTTPYYPQSVRGVR